MLLTLESAKRLVARMHRLLTATGAAERYRSLEAVQDLFAQSAGVTTWQQFAAFLGGGADAGQPALSNYSTETVRHAIAKTLNDPSGRWGARAVHLLDTAYAASASAFHTLDGIRALLGFEWLEQQQDIRDVRQYFHKLPNYSDGDRDGARLLHNYLASQIEFALANWELLLHPEQCSVPPPVTCDILMRCVDQHVEWPQAWVDWFKVAHG